MEPTSKTIAPQVSPSRYGWNDAQLREALEGLPDLTLLQEQLLYRALALSRLRGYAWLGRAEMAKLLRCCDRTLRTAIKALCARGLLAVTYGEGGISWHPRWDRLGLGDTPEHVAARATVSRQKLPPLHKIKDRDQELPDQDHTDERLEVRRELLREAREPKPEPVEPTPLDAVLERWGPTHYKAVLRLVYGLEGTQDGQATERALVKLVGASGAVANPAGYFRVLVRRERGEPKNHHERLLRALAAAEQRGDWTEAERVRDALYAYGRTKKAG